MTYSLIIVVFTAFAVPMLLSRFKLSLLPTSVAEIIVGIILGKSCLNIVHINGLLEELSTLGVIMLIFLSGMEIDFSIFKKNVATTPLQRKKEAEKKKELSPVLVAIIAYVLSLVTSFGLALLFKAMGLFSDIWLATILFSTIALGLVISLLKEKELLSKPFGQTILLIAVLGEVIPMLALTIYSAIYSGKGAGVLWISLVFVVGAILFKRFQSFFSFFDKITKSTTQLDVRLGIFIILTLVVLAEGVGAENILGAFVAGIVMKLLEPKHESQLKFDAIGYGFLIPIFFILTGIKLDIPAMMTSPKILVLIVFITIAYIVAKLPAFFGLHLRFRKINSFAGAMLSGTTITLVLAALEVAENLHAITEQQYGAFLLAALVTCIVCPLIFNKTYRANYESMPATMVHMLGVNLVTVSAAKQLSDDWYDVQMYTASRKSYTTYNSEAEISLLKTLTPNDLINQGVFDTDILVLGDIEDQMNYDLAVAAKEYGVERVVMRFEDRHSTDERLRILDDLGVEYFSSFEVNVGSLRSLIESPSTLELITSSESHLYEVTVKNAMYDGYEIKDLPMVERITISRIFRNHQPIAPHGSTQIRLDDHIIFSGSRNDVKVIKEKLENSNMY